MEQNLHSVSSSSSSEEDEDYINMEVSNHSSFDSSSSSIFSQSTNKEFEFQSFSSSSDRDHTTTSPADELFYMGKLLPLHLPPRLQMVHKILKNAAPFDVEKVQEFEDERFSTPLFTPSFNTPFESCNISPSESCHVSRELDPTQYLAEYYPDLGYKERPKKVKQMKWTSYLKSLFGKSSGCSDERSAAADQRTPKESNLGGGHRRSFSGAFRRLSKPKTSSSSSKAVNLSRSVCKSSEIDSPIQAAIAHCKRSQNSRQSNIGDELAFSSISASSTRLYD